MPYKILHDTCPQCGGTKGVRSKLCIHCSASAPRTAEHKQRLSESMRESAATGVLKTRAPQDTCPQCGKAKIATSALCKHCSAARPKSIAVRERMSESARRGAYSLTKKSSIPKDLCPQCGHEKLQRSRLCHTCNRHTPISDEQRLILSQVLTGRKLSAEHIQSLVDAHARQPIGARRIRADGYVFVKVSDTPPTWVQEHRIVMEEFIGRPLLRTEHVHHVNGDTSDNRLENLELHTANSHSSIEVSKKWLSPDFLRKTIATLQARLDALEVTAPE